jgi:hypothetical protein
VYTYRLQEMAVITRVWKLRFFHFIHELLASFMLFYAIFPISAVLPDSTYIGELVKSKQHHIAY